MRVFVTDAGYKHTLGVIRSLGRRNLLVDVGSPSSRITLSSFSRFASNVFEYHDPQLYPEKFASFVRAIHKKYEYDVVIPVGYDAALALSRFKRSLLKDLNIPTANYDSLRIAGNKRKTVDLAHHLDIPAPKTIVRSYSDLENIERDLSYPVVVKGIYGAGHVRYAYSGQDLKGKFKEIYDYQGFSPLVQEFIEGRGYGFFALFNHGNPIAIFMHRRIREYPISGGASTTAESVYEPKVKEYGLKVLKALNWHGVAMVEFKRDRKENDFKLMEINAKFWGSLDLAIASGVDFPYLLYRMATEQDVKPVFTYRTGVKFMWPFPDDLMHTLANPPTLSGFIKDLLDIRVKKNIKLNDLTPNIIQSLSSVAISWKALRTYAQFRYPHSIPPKGEPK